LVKDLDATFIFFLLDVVVCGIKNGAGVAKTILFLRNKIIVAHVSFVELASLLLVNSSRVLLRFPVAALSV
jgi:hypothetical protein